MKDFYSRSHNIWCMSRDETMEASINIRSHLRIPFQSKETICIFHLDLLHSCWLQGTKWHTVLTTYSSNSFRHHLNIYHEDADSWMPYPFNKQTKQILMDFYTFNPYIGWMLPCAKAHTAVVRLQAKILMCP